MEPTPKQQVIEQIKQAKTVLIAIHENPDGDALGSGLALSKILEKLGKKVIIVCSDDPNSVFKFLPRISRIKKDIERSNEFSILIPKNDLEIGKLGYKTTDSTLQIVLKLNSGKVDPSQIKFSASGVEFDLIIVLDTPNIERLGKLSQPTDLFFDNPIVNIDHHPSNEYFGQVNWVDFTATSTAEMMVSLIEALSQGEQILDPDIATLLLTGIIYDTSSFQNINTTPKSLTIAAQLVAAGGRQQEVIKNLYKTKSLATLKLWGTVLTNVKEDKQHRFIWSVVSRTDLDETGADESAISGVIDELLKKVTDLDFALMLSERKGMLHGSLRAISKGIDVSKIAELFGGGGHEAAAAFRIDGDLKSKEDEILNRLRQYQSKSIAVKDSVVRPPETGEGTQVEKTSKELPSQIESPKEETTTVKSRDGEMEENLPRTQEKNDDFSAEGEIEPKTKW